MKVVIHPAGERGAGEHGWLSTRYSFSFNTWYEPTRMGFGALRVLNDDRIAPGAGFPPHSHRDMEIITIVTKGAVAHADSTGSEGVTHAGEVQVMSAGSGVAHSEFNASDSEPLELFQLWIETKTPGIPPSYASKQFEQADGSILLVAPRSSLEASSGQALGIEQDAFITTVSQAKGSSFTYINRISTNGVYLFVIQGSVQVAEHVLSERDALGVSDTSSIEVQVLEDSQFLLIEVPMTDSEE